MTWIDHQNQAKVESALVKLRARRDAGEHRTTDYFKYADGDDRLALYFAMADEFCTRLVGVGIFDIGDYMWHDAYTGGMSPREAAREALEQDDTYQAFMGGGEL